MNKRGLLKKVSVISDESVPSIAIVNVTLHYRAAGEKKQMIVQMRRPTYFERVVVAVVQETLPSISIPQISAKSFRGLLRGSYQIAQRIGHSAMRRRKFNCPVLDLRAFEPNNMAHLLLDLVPFCLYARKQVGSKVSFLFRKISGPYVELLRIFNINPIYEPRKIDADAVKIRGTRGLALYDLPGLFDCPGIHFAPAVYDGMDFSSFRGFDKIFLARRGPRSLINQRETQVLLETFGYRLVFMEDYSVEQQLSIGAQARHVVAMHGASMGFLILSKQIDSVIELLPRNVYHELFPVSLGVRVARYEQLIPDFDSKVAHSGWPAIEYYKNLPFVVDLQVLESILSKIHPR